MDVLVVVQSLVEFELLHVLSILDLEVLRDAAGCHLLTHVVLVQAAMAVLVLRDSSPHALVHAREAGLVLGGDHTAALHDVGVQMTPRLRVAQVVGSRLEATPS